MIDLRLGDCLEIMRDMPAASVDAVITDPPYNVGLNYSDGDNRLDYREWCAEWFAECMRIAPFVIFTPGMVNLSMWYSIATPRWVMSWRKSNQCSPSPLGGFNTWEPILLYGKPSRRIGQDSWDMPIGLQQGVGNHPCPKYLPFWTKMLSDVTQEGETVLDPFAGTGTTLLAAHKLGRNAIGIEKAQEYFEIAQRRIAEAQAQMTLAI